MAACWTYSRPQSLPPRGRTPADRIAPPLRDPPAAAATRAFSPNARARAPLVPVLFILEWVLADSPWHQYPAPVPTRLGMGRNVHLQHAAAATLTRRPDVPQSVDVLVGGDEMVDEPCVESSVIADKC